MCSRGNDSDRRSTGIGQCHHQNAHFPPQNFIFCTHAVPGFMVLRALPRPIAASTNRKRLRNNQMGGESGIRRGNGGLGCARHPNPNIPARGYGQNEVIFGPFCHCWAGYHNPNPIPINNTLADTTGQRLMLLISGINGCGVLTRQSSVWNGVPPGTLLCGKVGYISTHTINDNRKTITRQSTIISE